MKKMWIKRLMTILSVGLILMIPSIGSAYNFAVWLDGSATSGGNAIPGALSSDFPGSTVTLVTTSQLATPGFLSPYNALIVSRFDASFGTFLSAPAAAQVESYVGSGASQGGVALFTNDMADNLAGGFDPYDPNLSQLFKNAVGFAAASGHGYVGEFNGAIMGMASNSAGAPALGFLPGSATAVIAYGPQFVYDVGPIGTGNPIDAGVTFPFTDADTSTFLTHISGADPNNIVDIYTSAGISGEPALLANQFVIQGGGPTPVPEPSTILLVGAGLAGVGIMRRRFKK